jgi:hypothetical protein
MPNTYRTENNNFTSVLACDICQLFSKIINSYILLGFANWNIYLQPMSLELISNHFDDLLIINIYFGTNLMIHRIIFIIVSESTIGIFKYLVLL